MGRLPRFSPLIAAGGVFAAVLGVAGLAASQGGSALPESPVQPPLPPLPAHPVTTPTPVGFLAQPVPDSTPNAEQVRRGQALTIAGDCMSCHLRPGGEPFAGGYGLNTPFGVIYSPNITSDKDTGIGAWTGDEFYRAMHDGIGRHGENLYPAFPYPNFSKASRADDDAILAYLKTTPAVHYTAPGNRLPFPLNIRFMVKGWNLFFFHPKPFATDPSQSAEWNRGAYLVNGFGHCGGCHTPKNFLAADKAHQDFQGGTLENWTAPNLTGSPRSGLAAWSVDDVTEYLKTGRNARAGAGGTMAEVVTYSTALMSDQDRHAIAVYLKSLPVTAERDAGTPDAGAMKRGAAIYSDACASCHLENGVGQPRYFPPLGHDAVVQQADPTGLEHLILAGSRIAPTPTRPSPLTMPSFAWKLTDAQIADVATYVRNSWGNQAAPISASKVRHLRGKLHLDKPRLTANSGDQG
jgi:mono/diheme cytochrome c family protein